jgi:hypothetical protein
MLNDDRKAGQDGAISAANMIRSRYSGHAGLRLMEQAHQQRQRLEQDQDAEGRDQGFEQEDRLDPADRDRAFEDFPGIAHRRPGPVEQRDHRRDQQNRWPKMSMRRRAAALSLGIEHVDAHMLVDQQRIARAQHEQRRMHVEHAFLRRDGVDAEDIAPDDDAELHQHHDQRQPADGEAMARFIRSIASAMPSIGPPHS